MNYVLSDNKEQVSLLDAFYPVGSYYITEGTTSPAALFGGEWALLTDRMLIGAYNDEYKGLYPLGKEDGATTVTLSDTQMPRHNHGTWIKGYVMNSNGEWGISNVFGWTYGGTDSGPILSWDYNSDYTTYRNIAGKIDVGTNSTGGGEAHNNMPPYRAVYMWKRTA